MPIHQNRPPFRRAPEYQRTNETITALVEQHSAALYRVAYSVLRNEAEAEDAVQEAFLRVLKHRDKIADIRDKRVWMVRIAWNVALDKTRRHKTRDESENIDDYARVLPAKGARAADEIAITRQEAGRILELVDQLPAKERESILLLAVEGLTTPEIAQVLKTTASSVRSRIFRARKLLRVAMDANKVDQDPRQASGIKPEMHSQAA